MANFSTLFFITLLGLGAPSNGFPYNHQQGSNHIQNVEPGQQQQDFVLAAPLRDSQGQAPSSQLAAPAGYSQSSSSPSSSELQQSPPHLVTDVEPMDQGGDSAEVLVQTLTEAERTNLVSYLICEMCKELQVSMCIRMCEGNGTQIEDGANSTESNGKGAGEETEDSVTGILGDSEEGSNTTVSDGNGNSTATEDGSNGGNSTATEDGSNGGNSTEIDGSNGGNSTAAEDGGDGGNSTVAEDGSNGGNSTESSGEGHEEDETMDMLLGEDGGQSGNGTVTNGNESGNSTVSSGFEGGNSTVSNEIQGDNSTVADGGESDESESSSDN